jgi:hypothetical protein
MKRLSAIAISLFSLVALAGVAQADAPARQEGRVWVYQNLTLAFTPNWSLTSMPGGRVEFARTREDKTGFHFLEYFIGPNYAYKLGNLTLKGSLWYYYMGYPQVGRNTETSAGLACASNASNYCNSNYNFSHNLEIIPAAEYRLGRWSFYDRIIFHNTFYADVYNTTNPGGLNLSVSDQRWGWGTVLRELLQARYAINDRLGVSLADEVFFGILKDSDTSKIPANGGYKGTGYWKTGYRLNRVYAGIDYKVTPALTVAPMYLLEVMSSGVDSADVTDISHTLYVTITYVAKLFDDKK